MVDHGGAALLFRVWLEDAGDFRARLLTLHECSEGWVAEETTVAVTSSPDELLDAVRDWLETVVRQPAGPVAGDR